MRLCLKPQQKHFPIRSFVSAVTVILVLNSTMEARAVESALVHRATLNLTDKGALVPHFPATVDSPDRTVSGAYRLPNGWHITPAGHTIPLTGDLPQGFVWSKDAKYLFVSTGGYHDQGVSVIDAASRRVVQTLSVARTFGSMTWNGDGTTLYLPGGHALSAVDSKTGQHSVRRAAYAFAWDGKRLTPDHNFTLNAADPDCYIVGLAHGTSGALYLANVNGDMLYRVSDGPAGDVMSTKTSAGPFAMTLSPDGQMLALCNWADSSVSLLDAHSLKENAKYRVGSHPNAIAFGPDGRLYVSNGGSNSVSVISGGRVAETIKTSLAPTDTVGSTPDALAVSPDGERLYVANADNNDVAVIDIADRAESRVIGFIPTAWYPIALTVSPDGKELYVGVGKGTHFSNSANGTYIAKLLNGAVSVVDTAVTASQLAHYTHQVYDNVPHVNMERVTSGANRAAILATFHKIKHVVYIIRENRTYDQVLGDIGRGNSDPNLTMFGQNITPNAHNIARRYVLLDNLYCNGEVSEDGHQWCDAAYATDFVERAWVQNYSGRVEPNYDDRLTQSPAGYLWDNCARHGLTYRSYGEFSFVVSSPTTLGFGGVGSLGKHSNAAYAKLSFEARDTLRSKLFIDDLKRAEKTGKWPQFIVMSLPQDHTHGLGASEYTPQACVASNDQALGQIVDAVSHSRFWKDTAILVIEDDAQDGQDHVDAHRTVGLVISPYVRRDVVDSTFYTTASFVHTIEIMLGLPPMSQFDKDATPLFNAYMPTPVDAPYNNLPPRINILAKNPAGPASIASSKLDFSAPDRVDPDVLNRMLWNAIKPGVPMPAPVRSVASGLLH